MMAGAPGAAGSPVILSSSGEMGSHSSAASTMCGRRRTKAASSRPPSRTKLRMRILFLPSEVIRNVGKDWPRVRQAAQPKREGSRSMERPDLLDDGVDISEVMYLVSIERRRHIFVPEKKAGDTGFALRGGAGAA